MCMVYDTMIFSSKVRKSFQSLLFVSCICKKISAGWVENQPARYYFFARFVELVEDAELSQNAGQTCYSVLSLFQK